MKKLFLSLAICSTQLSIAQSVDSYILKVETGKVYSPLTTGTNITAGLIWDEQNFKFPIGFSYSIGGKTTSDFCFSAAEGFGPATDTMGTVNVFSVFAASDLVDRGLLGTVPKSPLRYLTTGIAPNRIFKFEVFNAGFFDESDAYSTLNDSVNFQLWVYETSNIIEMRFGPSKITYPSDYFYAGTSPLIGYAKDYDLSTSTFPKAYTLTNSPSAPIVDSFLNLLSTPPVLDSYPLNGTVYRFIPKTVATSIGESTIATKFQVYPTLTTDNITVMAGNVSATRARIIDLNGNVVSIIQNIENGRNTIGVSHFATGNYVLELTNAEGKAVYKFTKQ
jgi:hypothetical protein